MEQENARKWSDFTHDERVEKFSQYVKYEIKKNIKEGIKVWETPEEKNQDLMPFNAITGRFYNGINSILLESEARRRNFANGAWISQNQARMAGIQIKPAEEKRGVKIAYIRKIDTQIKLDENGNPLTTPQLDKDGNVKINPATNEPYYRYVTEKVELEKPILETIYLFHSSQCRNLENITEPTISNNQNIEKKIILGDKIDLFPETKKSILEYLERQRESFMERKGYQKKEKIDIQRTYHENGQVKSILPMRGDEIHGVEKHYYENGNLKSEIPYQNGKRHGVEKHYYENGEIKKIAPYENGLINGTLKEFNEQGQELKSEKYEMQEEKQKENLARARRQSPQQKAEMEKKKGIKR